MVVFGDNNTFGCYDILLEETEGGTRNIYASGHSYSENYNSSFIIKVSDENGEIEWVRMYDRTIITTGFIKPNGNVIAFGGFYHEEHFSYSLSLILEFTPNGTLLNSLVYNNNEDEDDETNLNAIVYVNSYELTDEEERYYLLGLDDNHGLISSISVDRNTSEIKGFYIWDQSEKLNLTLRSDSISDLEIFFIDESNRDLLIRKYDIISEVNVSSIDSNLIRNESSKCTLGTTSIRYSQCHENYYEENCDVTTCDGVFSNETMEVCDGRGWCKEFDVCETVNLYAQTTEIRDSITSLLDYSVPLSVDGTRGDGGVVHCGYTQNEDLFLIERFGSSGEVLFSRSLSWGDGQEFCYGVEEMADGSIIISGKTEYYDNDFSVVARLDDIGHVLWSRIGSVASCISKGGLVIGKDRLIIVAGYCSETNLIYFMGIAPNSGLIFRTEMFFQGSFTPFVSGFVSSSSQDFYYFSGKTRDFGDTDICDPFFGKINNLGEPIWTTVLQDDRFCLNPKYIIPSGDGEFLYSCGTATMLTMIKLNSSDGSLIWVQYLDHNLNINIVESCNGMIESEDGRSLLIAVLFWAEEIDTHYDFMIMKISTENGDVLWSQHGDPSLNELELNSKIFAMKRHRVHERPIISGLVDHRSYVSVLDLDVIDSNKSFTTTKIGCDFVPINITESSGYIWGNVNISEVISYDINWEDTTSTYILLPPESLKVDTNIFETFQNFTCGSCVGVSSSDTSNVCLGRGVCVPNDEEDVSYEYKCDCQVEYLGDECDVAGFCFNISRNFTELVCSGMGECIDLDECQCDPELYFGMECEFTFCYGLELETNELILEEEDRRIVTLNQNLTCSGFGICNFSTGNCNCSNYSMYWGRGCDRFMCFGILNNDTENVCGGHGKCVDLDSCECDQNYTKNDCTDYLCFGNQIFGTPSSICHGHGNCTSIDFCECIDDILYWGEECESWSCNNFTRFDDEGCSNHGTCIDHDVCDCINDGYSGKFCSVWSCFGVLSFNLDEVCGSHGSCLDYDTCFCRSGYEPTQQINGPCVRWFCGEYPNSLDNVTVNPEVCNGRGVCESSHNCECKNDYEGSLCETWSCGFVDKNLKDLACSGNGECVLPGICECEKNYQGDDCETNLLYYTVLIPILSLSSIGFICCIICICCFVCLLCCFGFIVLIVSLISLAGVVVKQMRGLRKFSKLRNFDLLLREQELEEDTSIAHIRINKDLYQIPYEEIKLKEILGEGGSNSTVYRASWNDKDVAFKCFRTRTVCNDQNSFDEFEREVTILGSVSHPHVLQFFGCSLKPPRVGIVMEFCEKGDLQYFLKMERIEGNGVEFGEKLSFCIEISLALAYLHSRSIIHRDLKLENVLVDDSRSCKLMDFGLSKIVDRMSQVKTKSIGTSYYMAPELLKGEYTEKVDVFAFAICCYIMITENYHPYGIDTLNVEMRVANDPTLRPELKKLDSCCSGYDNEWIKDLLEECWNDDAESRPSFQELSGKLRDGMKRTNEEKLHKNEREEEEEEDDDDHNNIVKKKKKKKNDDEIVELKTFSSTSVVVEEEKDEKIQFLSEEVERLKKVVFEKERKEKELLERMQILEKKLEE